MEKDLEKAANYALINRHANISQGEFAYNQNAMLDMFAKGAKWQRTNAWISVKDRVPENQDIVLVRTDENSFSTAYFHGKKGGFIIYGEDAYIKFGEITHWMVIPNID